MAVRAVIMRSPYPIWVGRGNAADGREISVV